MKRKYILAIVDRQTGNILASANRMSKAVNLMSNYTNCILYCLSKQNFIKKFEKSIDINL